tara:strand:+ start:376 stop:1437 length:1062 start_codon:yes stop_codon:yes gene_type:complete
MCGDWHYSAMRGKQAGRDFYVAMVPMIEIPKLFVFSEEVLPANLRAQRTIKESRIPPIRDYILNNPEDYVFSSLTASVDGVMKFRPAPALGEDGDLGQLEIPMSSKLLINDGQHRRRAIEEALKIKPELGNEFISIVFFTDKGLKRSQQMFADLNKHAVKPSKSLGILYDIRNQFSQFIVNLTNEVDVFRDRVELEKTSISNRSTKFFTTSGIENATARLLDGEQISEEKQKFAKDFWNEVARNIGHWKNLMDGKVTASELRENYVHAHSNLLSTLGYVGSVLYNDYQDSWKQKLEAIRDLPWEKTDPFWEGKLVVGNGRMMKSQVGMKLAANAILQKMGIPLDEKREKWEKK